MLVLIFSTLRQVSVKVLRSPPSGPSLRAGGVIAVIGGRPPVPRLGLFGQLLAGGR